MKQLILPPRCLGGQVLVAGVALSCVPSVVDAPASDGSSGVFVGDSAGSGDGSDALDGGDGSGSGQRDTGIEQVPGLDTEVVFSPRGQGFVDRLEVTLAPAGSAGEVWACRADPDETDCTLAPVDGPLELTRSTVLHAVVRNGTVEGEQQAQSYVEVDEDLAGFTSNLPVLVLWTDGRLPESKTDPQVAGLTVLDPDGGRVGLLDAAADSARARFRIRGSSSAGFDKPSWDLELWAPDSEADREVALLGMAADADWILYSAYYYDDALMRNALAFETSRAVGRWASRDRFVEVFAAPYGAAVSSAHYMGVYDLIEEIERGRDRVDIERLEPGDLDGESITGGYLFKRDRGDDDDAGIVCGTAGGQIEFNAAVQAVDPEEHELAAEQVAYLKAECDAAGEASLGPDWTDPGSGRRYSEIIDAGSFIDHHILNVIFKNPDAFRLSGYFFKDRSGLLNAGPVWDFDRACDSTDSRARYPTWWDAGNQTNDTTKVFEFGWYEGLMEEPDYADAYWARWTELLAGPLSKSEMDARIVRMAEELEEAAGRNNARWGGQDFASEVASLRDWMGVRHDWIAACIASADDPRTCRGD